ncbi:MAG: 4a-hydroxytetrahydrobiopterin dehydratase [Candidatus Limnocylindria bacterium]
MRTRYAAAVPASDRARLAERERRLTEPLLTELVASLAEWARDGEALTKTFTFKGFKGAMAFANRAAEAANAAGHHPDIHIERYRDVRIVLTTHASGGISQADIDLANAIDAAAAPPRPAA